jgi:hypothetical protein
MGMEREWIPIKGYTELFSKHPLRFNDWDENKQPILIEPEISMSIPIPNPNWLWAKRQIRLFYNLGAFRVPVCYLIESRNL